MLVAVGIGAVAATTVADVWAKRSEHAAGAARKVSRLTGPTAVAAVGVAATAGWATATATERFWRRGKRRDLGGGLGPAALAIAGWDFLYYWNHRLMHETRAMWAFHVVHHSSQRYNLSTALRQPVAESLGLFAPYGLMSLGGIRPAHVELARGVNLLYQYWFHTDTVRSLGPLEKVLNTASHHRVHHASNQRYIDRNHGSILIVWDRLFGTFCSRGPRGSRRLRPDQEHRHVQPVDDRHQGVRRHPPRRLAQHHLARPPVVRRPRTGVVVPTSRPRVHRELGRGLHRLAHLVRWSDQAPDA